ncbi:hypothetical protein [Verminephrobacter eiseniae]|nr:hypothetical protein [Verminephrobacter eiseniae]
MAARSLRHLIGDATLVLVAGQSQQQCAEVHQANPSFASAAEP